MTYSDRTTLPTGMRSLGVINWTGSSFDNKYPYSGADYTSDLHHSGQFDALGRNLLNATFVYTEASPSKGTKQNYEFRITNLPLETFTQGSYVQYSASGSAAAAAVQVVRYSSTSTYGPDLVDVELDSINWTSSTVPPKATLVFRPN